LFSIRLISAAVLLSLKQNLMQILCSFNILHFDNRRHTRKRCQENSQSLETLTLIKTPVGWLTVEKYSKRHVAAQVRSANGLRGISKFSEILGSTSYADEYWHFHIYLHAHDLAPSPDLWYQPRLAIGTYAWSWRLCGINPVILQSE
jgi:hypothetical protein